MNVGLRVGKHFDPLRDIQNEQPSKCLLPADSDELESNGDHDEYLFRSTKGIVIKEAS